MKDKKLEGSYVYLRSMMLEDIPNVVKWLSDKDITRFLDPKECSLTQESIQRQFEEERESLDDFIFTIVYGKDDLQIGRCGLHNIDWTRKDAYMRIIIGDKKFWNGRAALEAEKLLLQYAFEHLDLHKVYGYVNEENLGQQKLVERVGLKKDGILKDHIFKDGKYFDAFSYSILKNEYELHKKTN